MNFNSRLFLVCLLFLLSSCGHKDEYLKHVMNELNKLEDFDNKIYSHVIIIPGSGCSGCISEGEDFFMENNDNQLFFIFTKVSSIKLLKLKFGTERLSRKNVLIDEQNVFYVRENNMNHYPMIIDLRNRNHIVCKVLEPGENMNIVK